MFKETGISMSVGLPAPVETCDISQVKTMEVDGLLEDPGVTSLRGEKFGDDPGAYPKAVVPLEVQPEELVYLKALVDAHNAREPGVYGSHTDIFAHPSHGSNLRTHRERYFEADAFPIFYHDNTTSVLTHTFRPHLHLLLRQPFPPPPH